MRRAHRVEVGLLEHRHVRDHLVPAHRLAALGRVLVPIDAADGQRRAVDAEQAVRDGYVAHADTARLDVAADLAPPLGMRAAARLPALLLLSPSAMGS